LATETNVLVKMIRLTLKDIPQHAVPAGYVLRLYEPGDEAAWVAVNGAADKYNRITLETFRHEFKGDLAELRRRCFFLREPGGRDVGTATSWYNRDYHGRDIGRIHWVAILPEFQGKGLAKPMMTVAMNRLAELHDSAYLSTGVLRLVAIKIYLDFGFVPEIEKEADLAAWQLVRNGLHHPLLDDASCWHRY
jgi:GNAT superfamily N-acetyltransferase